MSTETFVSMCERLGLDDGVKMPVLERITTVVQMPTRFGVEEETVQLDRSNLPVGIALRMTNAWKKQRSAGDDTREIHAATVAAEKAAFSRHLEAAGIDAAAFWAAGS